MTGAIGRDLRSALRLTLFFGALCGLVYPLLLTGVSLGLFPSQSRGSLVERDGATVGSELIGQAFNGRGYFHGRPSAAGDGYDATSSSGSNLGPTSAVLIERVVLEADRIRIENGLPAGAPLPVDAVTASASGLDPHISPAYAQLQVPRVARERGLSEDAVRALVRTHTDEPALTIGVPRVNVLLINLALDELDR